MIKNLQVLRAIAALLVVFFHCDFLGLKIGQFGVDIFFVISGYIISFILNKRTEHFLLKRFIRVIPMYYFFTCLVILVWLFYPQGMNNVYISASSIFKSFLFIPYTVGASGPILSNGWTLNYEIFFYVLVGTLVMVFKKPTITLFSASLIIVSIIVYSLTANSSNEFLSFYSNQITLEFIFGIFLYYLTNSFRQMLSTRPAVIIAAFIALISFVIMVYCDFQKIYFSRVLLFGIPSFFVVLFFITSESFTKGDNRIYNYFYEIGNASYVVYLAHPFIIFFIARLISPIFGANLFYTVIELALKLLLVVLVSNWIHNKIELPVVKSIERFLYPH
ncbi:MAG: acyltransferase [Bacteroidota bacterium]